METYISILRGINVSGQKKILMVDLKSLYEKEGFKNVITYIQSGNVIFNTNINSESELIQIIEKSILNKYNFEVPVIVFPINELKGTIKNNPFIKEKGIDEDKLHITFLSSIPTKSHVELLNEMNFSTDRFSIKEKVIYVYCPNGYGNTKLSNTFFEKKLSVKATTRNWKTTNKLLEIYTESFK